MKPSTTSTRSRLQCKLVNSSYGVGSVKYQRPGKRDKQALLLFKTSTSIFNQIRHQKQKEIREQLSLRDNLARIIYINHIPHLYNGKIAKTIAKAFACKSKVATGKSAVNLECLTSRERWKHWLPTFPYSVF